jgi:tRNA nucleotidyltransferase/poly(A) polymerase
MPALPADPAAGREFAGLVVTRLREAGHESYWAGGCVRDEILGRTPVDYDVATAARPDAVRDLFGRRRTLAVGAAFGVITVLGPRGAGQVEVATFREDALRRDFTINGLFLDPASGEVLDFVGGRADLAAGVVRAIGVPALRFGEDHLRMLRAVRFAAVFGFVIEAETRAALERMAHLVAGVSPERVAAELRGMVSRPGRRRALELLDATGLAREVLAEVAPGPGLPADRPYAWATATAVVDALDEPDLPLAVAALAEDVGAAAIPPLAGRLRLATRETKKAAWLQAAVGEVGGSTAAGLASRPWSSLQPLVAHEHAVALADLLRARAACGVADAEAAAWFTGRTARPRAEIDPPPLVSGDDLLAAGLPAGRELGAALAKVRRLQLDGLVTSRAEAIAAALEPPA